MELGELIKILSGKKQYFQHECTVVSVDEPTRTCVVKPKNGDADLQGVRLQSVISSEVGIYVLPEVKSNVIVGFLDEHEAFIIQTSKVSKVEIIGVESIKLNGDSFGGLIKIQELTSKLNALVSDFNAFVQIFNAHIHITTATVGASPTPGTIAPTMTTVNNTSNFNKTDFENEIITHGERYIT